MENSIKNFEEYFKLNEDSSYDWSFDNKVGELESIINRYGIEYSEEVEQKIDELLLLIKKQIPEFNSGEEIQP